MESTRAAAPHDPDAAGASPDRPPPPAAAIGRRDLLAGAAAAVGGAVAARAGVLLAQQGGAGAPAPAGPAAPDPTKVQGRVPNELGTRSAHERPRRRVNRAAPSGESETPLQELHGVVTPSTSTSSGITAACPPSTRRATRC
jgi:hypothetical protein